MTILESLNWANEKLKKANIDSPMLDAQVILANILKVSKSWLFSNFDFELQSHQEEQFFIAMNRRSKHEPVAYIIEVKPFYGRTFFVNPSVLIPRPATEIMIEEVLKISKKNDSDKTLICDIGTGSGAIALTLALETSIPVIATDSSRSALSVAKKNALLLNVSEVEFREGNLLEPIIHVFQTIKTSNDPNVSSIFPFTHLIICANLPYLSNAQMETLSQDVRHEPPNALQAGPDGLDAYYHLFKQLAKNRVLFPRYVSIFIEIDQTQKQKAVDLIAHNFPTTQPVVMKDLQNLDRVILVQM